MIEIKTLENGMTIVVDHKNSPITSFGMLVKVGSQNESQEFEGVSHFVEHLMFKSTKTRTTGEIAEQLAFLGTESNAYTSKTHTLYHFKSLTENFEESFKIYADMLQNGILEKSEVDPEREVVIEEMKRAEDDAISLLFYNMDEQMYSGDSYAHRVLGSEEIIKNISIAKIKEYIKTHYTPDNMIMSISGGVTMEQAEELLKKYYPNYFETKALPKKQDKTPYDIKVKDKYVVCEKDDKQVNILVTTKGASIFDDDYYTQTLFCSILGEDSSSRLFMTLREKMGLAYSVSAFAYPLVKSGTVVMYIGTSKEKISNALVGMKKVIYDMAKNGVSKSELQKAKNQIKSKLMFQSETMQGVMKQNAVSLFDVEKISTSQEILEKIDKVTIQDIKRFAKQVLLEQEFVVCAVGKDINKSDLKVYETCLKKTPREPQKENEISQERITNENNK